LLHCCAHGYCLPDLIAALSPFCSILLCFPLMCCSPRVRSRVSCSQFVSLQSALLSALLPHAVHAVLVLVDGRAVGHSGLSGDFRQTLCYSTVGLKPLRRVGIHCRTPDSVRLSWSHSWTKLQGAGLSRKIIFSWWNADPAAPQSWLLGTRNKSKAGHATWANTHARIALAFSSVSARLRAAMPWRAMPCLRA